MHVETERASEKLVNRRLAYVAVSRGRYDAQIYTDDKGKLARTLDRNVSHRSALERDSDAPLSSQNVGYDARDRTISQTNAVGHS